MKNIVYLIYVISLLYGQIERPVCGTPAPSQDQIDQIGSAVDEWSNLRDNERNEMKMVFVAWHIVHASNAVSYTHLTLPTTPYV